MQILIVGAGDIGLQLAKRLAIENFDIAMIETDPRKVKRAREQVDALVIEGHGASYGALKTGGIHDADIVAAMTNNDEVNILVCQMAKKAGVADTLVVPDQVIWTVHIVDLDKSLKSAKQRNDEKLAAVLEASKELAASPRDREIGRVAIDRIYSRDAVGGIREFAHFQVRRTVKIRQRDISEFEAGLNLLIDSAEIEVSFQYEVSESGRIYSELQLRAFEAARSKAQALAEHAESNLGDVSLRRLLGVARQPGGRPDAEHEHAVG